MEQLRESKATSQLKDDILEAVCSGEKIFEIQERLRKNESYESIAEWLGKHPAPRRETLSPRVSHHSYYEASDHDHEMGGVSPKRFRWTTVTEDTGTLDHLFQLYFAWVHPVHTLFDERRFVQSYKGLQEDNFCSSVLVNAICAMACHLNSSDGEELEHLKDDFSEATRAALDGADSKVTMVQAFAVMFLVDCARANVLRAEAYLRVATRGLTKAARLKKSEQFEQTWRSTVCGIRNLNVSVIFSTSAPAY